jgi:hypothetical protein
MAQIISLPPRDAIQIRGHFGGKELWGWYRVYGGIATVWHTDGRQATAQVGGSPPETLAKVLLLELEKQQ